MSNIISLHRPRDTDKIILAQFDTRQDAPFSEEAESAALGAVLLNPAIFPAICDILNKDKFFFIRNGMVWRALEILTERGEAIDNITVSNVLHENQVLDKIGGPAYLTQLIRNVPTSTHAEVYARMVERLWIRRELMKTADNIKALAYDTSKELEQVCALAESQLTAVTQRGIKHSEQTTFDAANMFLDRLEAQLAGATKGVYIPTGWPSYNEKYGGLKRSTATALLGFTGLGKSLWLTSLAYDLAELGFHVYLASNELTITQMMTRLVAIACGLNTEVVTDVRLASKEQYSRVVEGVRKIANLPINLDYALPFTPAELRGKAIRTQRTHGLDVILYDGIYNSDSGDPAIAKQGRTAELRHVSQQLIKLAKDMDVPLLYTQQARREIEKRPNKRPTIFDSEYSHKVVQDADLVLGLHREWVFDKSISPTIAELITLKNRDGGYQGTINQFFNAAIPRFEEGRTVKVNLGSVNDKFD